MTDEDAIQNYIDDRMKEELSIKNPIGVTHLMKQKSIPIYFDDGRMVGIAIIKVYENGYFHIEGGSDTDPKITPEEIETIAGLMLITEASGIIAPETLHVFEKKGQ